MEVSEIQMVLTGLAVNQHMVAVAQHRGRPGGSPESDGLWNALSHPERRPLTDVVTILNGQGKMGVVTDGLPLV